MIPDINQRFRELRKACKKSQEEWADIMRLSRSGIADIEAGRRNVTEKHIRLLSIESIDGKYINEDWLRTGDGYPFKKLTRNQVITDFAADLIKEDDSFKSRLIEALAKLSDDEWEVLEKLAVDLSNKKDQGGEP